MGNISDSGSDTTIVSLYDFEYRLLPAWIDALQRVEGTRDKVFTLLSDKVWLTDTFQKLNFVADFSWNDLLVKSFVSKFSDNLEWVIVFTFPAPSRIPLAKYAAIVGKDGKTAYYTLEKSESVNYSAALFEGEELTSEESWVLGGVDQRRHINFGVVASCPTIDDFLHLLVKRGVIQEMPFPTPPKFPSSSSFIDQSKYVADDGNAYRVNDDGSFTSLGPAATPSPVMNHDSHKGMFTALWCMIGLLFIMNVVTIGLYFSLEDSFSYYAPSYTTEPTQAYERVAEYVDTIVYID